MVFYHVKKIFSFDAETDGLYGNPFAVAAIVYQDGQEIARFIARLSDCEVAAKVYLHLQA